MSGKRRKYLIASVALLVGLFIAFLIRDLRLSSVDSDEEKVTFVVEKVHYKNIIDHDVYVIDAEKGIRSSDEYILDDVYITIETEDGKIWNVKAAQGSTPDTSGGIVTLKQATGVTKVNDEEFHWQSPEVQWNPNDKLFFFDEGIRVLGETVEVESQRGQVHLSGEMYLSGGARVIYKAPKE